MSNESVNNCITDDYKLKTSYKDGLKHGIEIYSDEFGVIETPFYEGKIHGCVKQYEKNENELDCVKIPYVKGKIHGVAENYYGYRQIYINDMEILRVHQKNIPLSTVNTDDVSDDKKIYLAICKISTTVEIYNKNFWGKTNKISLFLPDNIHGEDFYKWITLIDECTDTIWTQPRIERVFGCGNIGFDPVSKRLVQQIIKEVSDEINILTVAEILSVIAKLIKSYDLEYVKSYITKNYDVFSHEAINNNNISDETIPLIALKLFLESKSFEDAISKAISTNITNNAILFIVSRLASIYYGVPKDLYNLALKYLNDGLIKIYNLLDKNSN